MLFDKRGAGTIPASSLGDILRALGQNPTQHDVAELVAQVGPEIDYDHFLTVLRRPNGYDQAGTAGTRIWPSRGRGDASTDDRRRFHQGLPGV